MLNTQFFDTSEDKCWNLFKKFNDEKLHLSDVGRTKQYFDFDASGITSVGDKIAIELKNRNLVLLSGDSLSVSGESRNGAFSAPSIYLEEHKLAEMAVANWADSFIPIYINFLDNCIIVFNLLKMKNIGDEKTRVHSKGFNNFEIAKRFTLPLTDAWIYNNTNYALIYKP